VPLGPKQIERVSAKVIRRFEETRTVETLTATETMRETADTSKDSSEVVAEASKSFNWSVEAEASASYGTASGSITASVGGDSASSSRETKSRLNETMEKTAAKMRSETKVVVSTRQEQTFEQEQSSEISNGNEEIAVTYVYSRLQRQYEIATRLAEVNSVVFIAETVPHPSEITGNWIRRFDWILQKVLLDESFVADLAAVRSRHELEVPTVDTNFNSLMGTVAGGLPATYTGQSDIFKNPQDAYERELQRVRSHNREDADYRARELRLIRHIQANILHYCRAIWSSEDPEARQMRFYDIQVPIRWEFYATGSADATGVVPGYYQPVVMDEGDQARLSEIVNPAGPIGFAGNYAVYYMKPIDRLMTLNHSLTHLRAPYLRFELIITPPVAGAGPEITSWAIEPNRFVEGRYRLSLMGALWIERETTPGNWIQLMAPFPYQSGAPFSFDRIRLTIQNVDARPFRDGDAFIVEVVATPFLEDPELKLLKWTVASPQTPAQEAAYFTRDVIQEMGALLPQVDERLQLEALPNPSWGELTAQTRDEIRDRFHEFLLAREHTRRFLLETNNILLDMEIGTTSAVEDFKRLHRYIDVLKVFEEREGVRVENVRRAELLRADRLGDPRMDKLTIVADGADAILGRLDGIISP
jgi:hypothetical protein